MQVVVLNNSEYLPIRIAKLFVKLSIVTQTQKPATYNFECYTVFMPIRRQYRTY